MPTAAATKASAKVIAATKSRPSLGGPAKPNVSVKWELITPAKAEAYLALNFERNRQARRHWVEYLADQMATGQFKPTHQGVAFDEGGWLIDGQHRLKAVVASGTSQWILVSRNVPRDSVFGVDVHARRNVADQIRVVRDDMSPTKSGVALARAVYGGGSANGHHRRIDGNRLVDFMISHSDALAFAIPTAAAKGTAAAPLRAAIARAWYHVDRDRLKEFIAVLESGVANGPEDSAAVRMRELVMRSHLGGGDSGRAELFRKTCYAINAFVSRTPIGKIYATQGNPYPLPEEVEEEAARLRELREAEAGVV